METYNVKFYHISCIMIMLCSALRFVQPLPGIKDIPGRPEKAYRQSGDINIGAFFSISQYSTTSLCGDKIRFPLLQQYVEALVFAIDTVNKDDTLLPNVTLGFIMLDDCTKEATAVSQALRFLPTEKYQTEENVNNNVNVNDNDDHNVILELSNTTSSNPKQSDDCYDVIGVIGPLKSSNSIAVSYLLGPAQVPQLSFLATSDELSQKEKHPYFLRVVPPDGYQMRAIVEFILRQGWTYFSVVYTSGSYGELAFSNIKIYASSFSLCIATEHKLLSTTTEREYRKVVQDLLNHPRARVVILVSGDGQMKKIFTEVHRMNATGKFIWIGTDGWAERLSTLPSRFRDSLLGSFTTTFYAPTVPEFNLYFRSLKPSTSRNPWFSEFWERQFSCSFEDDTCDEGKDVTSSEGFEFLSLTSYAIDSVYVYARALHTLLSEQCPDLSGKDARRCVTGEVLLQYLKNVSFVGYTGDVMFDKLGNLLGKYVVRQIRPGIPLAQVPVKIIDVSKSYKVKEVNPIEWDYVQPIDTGFGPNAKFPKTRHKVTDALTPVSVCSRVCEPGEQIVYMEQDCCWECRKCRENERLTNNMTRCEKCAEFFWPDDSTNFTSCTAITPDFPDSSEPYVIILMCVSVIGVSLTIVVIVFYIINREARVIKASSRELSFLQLFAILLGYLTIMVYVATPSPASCTAAFYMFCLSFNWLYAPLLVKTVRIFRIFDSGRKGTRPLTFVSPLSQVVLASSIIFGQICICIAISFVSTPTSHLTHKIQIEKYVELSCDLTTAGFTSFLAYNLTLIVLCSVFAFKTRKLPANFNESRFISMCVSTTLVIWLAFIPSYATSSREYLKSLYLSLALVLNHSVAFIFLFLTRLYAVYYVDEMEASGSRIGGGGGGGSHMGTAASFRSRTRNTVVPITPSASPTPTPIAAVSNNNNNNHSTHLAPQTAVGNTPPQSNV